MKGNSLKDRITRAVISNHIEEVEDILLQNGIKIRNDETGELREFADLMEEIGEKWDEIK